MSLLGQQQLLLIVLAIIIVGIAIALSISLFRQNAIDTKRDLLINECIALAMNGQNYYKKPPNLGGGGRNFIGWTIPQSMTVTASGSYSATVFRDSVVLTGTGNDVVSGSDSVKVRVSVYSDAYKVQIIN